MTINEDVVVIMDNDVEIIETDVEPVNDVEVVDVEDDCPQTRC